MDIDLLLEKIEPILEMIVAPISACWNYSLSNQSEANFMLSSNEVWNSTDPKIVYFFLAAYVIMFLCVWLSADKMFPKVTEETYKISMLKVTVFVASVFAFHVPYNLLVDFSGKMLGADGSVRALDCIGSFINPVSIMIYAFALCTLMLKNGRRQAIMLGLAIFFMPAVMTYYSFTPEHISIYVAGIVIALVGGFLYDSDKSNARSLINVCFILDIVYFIVKFFMISYSEQVALITAENIFGKIQQYLTCIEMDLIYATIFLLVLFVYQAATTENMDIKKNLIFPCILLFVTVISILFGRVGMSFQPDYEQAVALYESEQYEEAKDIFVGLHEYKDSEEYIELCMNEINKAIYEKAIELMDEGSYQSAYEQLEQLSEPYRDSWKLVDECKKQMGYTVD